MDVLVVGHHIDDAAGHAAVGQCSDGLLLIAFVERRTASTITRFSLIERNGRGEYSSNMFRRLKHPYQPTDGARFD